jgi:flagellar hook-basal body complex protein FliE
MSDWNIAPLGKVSETLRNETASRPEAGAPNGFGQWLAKSLSEVDQLQKHSDMGAQKLITGENKDIHGTMIALQKAGIAMDLVVEIRNKVIAAYDEVKRMQF